MKAGEFIRRRERIERDDTRRQAYKRRALQQLEREAGAVAKVVDGKLVGWVLGSGANVCVKRRYANQAAAALAIGMIRISDGGHVRPIRFYACDYCKGWHLTSKQVT